MSKWDDRFFKLATEIATWSKDPNRKVGCVVADDQHFVVAMGYNGFPKEMDDSPEALQDQGLKRIHMRHAEVNALMRLKDPRGVAYNSTPPLLSLYCTTFPCNTCAEFIANKRINTVWAPEPDLDHSYWGELFMTSLRIFNERGISVNYYPNVGEV